MKFCKDCKYYCRDIWCKHPSNGVSYETGDIAVEWAILNRKPQGNCKEQGLLFEQKELLVKKSMISRIISWFKGE